MMRACNICSKLLFCAEKHSYSLRKRFHIYDRLHLAVSNNEVEIRDKLIEHKIVYFSIDDTIDYEGFADDFGPMNLASIFNFCSLMDKQLALNPDKSVALQCLEEEKAITNAVFLIGAYLVMKHGLSVVEVVQCCASALNMTVAYRDVSPGPQNFFLHVKDCWAGLHRAKQLH